MLWLIECRGARSRAGLELAEPEHYETLECPEGNVPYDKHHDELLSAEWSKPHLWAKLDWWQQLRARPLELREAPRRAEC